MRSRSCGRLSSNASRANPSAAEWSVILEYELPMEGGRRPDVVVLAGETVIVLEFKGGMVKTDRVGRGSGQRIWTRPGGVPRGDPSEWATAASERSVVPLLVLTANEFGGTDPDRAIVVGRQDVAGGCSVGYAWLPSILTTGFRRPTRLSRRSYRQRKRSSRDDHCRMLVDADRQGFRRRSIW